MAARATAARGADEGKIRAIATAAQGDFKRITRATTVKDNSKGKAAAAAAETDNFGPETPGLSFGGGELTAGRGRTTHQQGGALTNCRTSRGLQCQHCTKNVPVCGPFSVAFW